MDQLRQGIKTKLLMVLCTGVFSLVSFIHYFAPVHGATGTPRILSHHGRLLDSSGNLLGGSGTNYCFKFSLYDDTTPGGSDTKLWPSGSPSTMTVNVKYGVFSVGIGDTGNGGDALDYNFQDNDTIYLNVEVAAKVGSTCAPGDGAESFENLSPRQRILSSAYAINSEFLNGNRSGVGAGNVLKITSGGNISFGGKIYATSSVSSILASSTVVATGNILGYSGLAVYGSGTSTFSGKVEISSKSLVNGSAICTANNGLCSNAAAGGWTDDGSIVRLSSVADQVSIGSASSISPGVLNVHATSTTATALIVRGVANQAANVLKILDSSNASLFTIGASGNVGISTSTPGFRFSAEGNAFISGNLRVGAITSTSTLIVSGTGTSTFSGGIYANDFRTNLVNCSQALETDSTGAIVCGTDADTAVATDLIYRTLSSTKYYSASSSASDNLAWHMNNGFVSSASSSIAGGDLTVIGGSVGIGTTTPAQTFSLANSAYIVGGLGIGNATTTSGVLETSGLAYIGGLLKVKGTGTSTISDGLTVKSLSATNGLTLTGGVINSTGVGTSTFSGGIFANDLRTNLVSCDSLDTNSSGAIICGADAGGSAIISINSLTATAQTLAASSNDPLVTLSYSNNASDTHTFTLTASSSPTYGYIVATSTTATSVFKGKISVEGNTTLTNATSSALSATLFGIGSDHFNDITGSNLQISGSALAVVSNPTFSGLTTLSGGFLSTSSSTVGAPLFVTEGVYASSSLQVGSYVRSYGSATSTFTGGIYANDLRTNLSACSGTNALTTDSSGAIVCSALTFSAAGGWTDDGHLVRLTTISDQVGIASSTIPGTAYGLGVGTSTYIAGGLGIGNATTTNGVLETSGLTYIGGLLKIKGTGTSTVTDGLSAKSLSSTNGLTLAGGVINSTGTGTSTFGGGLSVSAGGISIALPSCTELTTDSSGAIVCGTDDAAGTFTLAGNGGSNQTLTSGDTISLFGGNNLTTYGANTDTLYVDLSSTLNSMGDIFATTSGSGIYASSTIVATGNLLTYANIGASTSSPTQALSINGSGYIVNGLGIGNATTTSGVLETSGLAYIGGVLKVAGTATSTITGGLYANDIRINYPNCNGSFVLESDANGAITCGADAGAGGGITSINSLTNSSQTLAAASNDPLVNLVYSNNASDTHTFTITASSSPTFGYVHATSTTATSIFDGALTVNGNTTLTNATSTSLQATSFGIGSDYFNDITGTNLEINGSALSVVANPTFAGLTTFTSGFISTSSSTVGAPLFVSEGVYATGTIQTGSYIRSYGTASSTFAGGITITAGGINFALPSCLGSNALTTDASGGVICSAITGDGTGGWTDDGHLVRLTTSSDQVGIGSSTIPGNAYGLGVGTSTYIAGGLGIGNATTTSGVLETSGLSYIGGLLKVKGTGTSTISDGLTVKSLSATNGLTLTGGVIKSTGTGTSTFAGGISITGASGTLQLPHVSCTGSSKALTTDTAGNVLCGTISGTGMTSFTAAGDSGSNQTISDADTYSILGGNNITTRGANTDTLYIDISSTLNSMGDIFATTSGSGIYASSTIVATGNLLSYANIGASTSSPTQAFSINGSGYITGGFGIGNATTTSGVLETSGLAYIGGVLKVASTATSTVTGGLYVNDVRTNLVSCDSLDTNSSGALVCGTDAGGTAITSLNGLTDSTQTFSLVNNDPLVSLAIGSVSPTHTFTITASSSPAYGYVHATSTTATSIFDGALSVNGNTTLTNATSSSLQATVFGVGNDYLNDLTGTNLEIAGSALGVVANPTFTGLTTFTSGFISTASSTVGAPLFVSEGVYATGTIQTGSYIRAFGSATSTFTGGIFVNDLRVNLPSCTEVTTDASGGIVCGTDDAAGSFTLAGDAGANQALTSGDTISIKGGNNITTYGQNTDTLYVDLTSTLNSMGDIFATTSGSGVYASSTIVATGNLLSYASIGASTSSPVQALSINGSGYIVGGFGVGNATTTSGVLETSGFAYIGGALKVAGSATSTIVNGLAINAGGLSIALPNCDSLDTNGSGAIVCGTDAGSGAITSLNGLTDSTQTFAVVNNDPLLNVAISSVSPTHTFTITASSSPTYGYIHATSTTATSIFDGALTVNGNTTLTHGTSTSLQTTAFGVGSDYFNDLTGTNLEITNSALSVVANPTFTGLTTFTSGFISTASSTIGAPLFATEGIYASSTIQTGSYIRSYGSATSTFTGGIYANDVRTNLVSCNTLDTDSSGAIICGSDEQGAAVATDLIYRTLSSTKYYTASSSATDNLAWHMNNGFVSSASSSIAGGNLTVIGGSVGIGTTTPAQALSLANSAYIVGGLGIGNATTTSGVLETSGLALIGGVVKVNSSGTSTITGGLSANDIRINLLNCSGSSVLETDASGAITCGSDGTGGNTLWDLIGDPLTDGAITMGETTQSFDWDTGPVSALDKDYYTLSVVNDSAADIATQRLLVLENKSASVNTVENLMRLLNSDSTAVANGIMIDGNGFTTAIDVSDSDIGTALSTGANDIIGSNFSILGGLGSLNASSTAHVTGNFTGGGYLNIFGSATSTFTGGLYANDLRTNLSACSGANALTIDSSGAIVCSALTLTAAGGWTDEGHLVRLTSISDQVGIGSSTIPGNAYGLGVSTSTYIAGGLGIGNATTTSGVLETSGLSYIGGLLKVKGTGTSTVSDGLSAKSLSATNGLTLTGGVINSTGTGTSTFAGGLYANALQTNLLNCDTIDTNASGALVCGTDAGGTAITSLNGLTDATQTFSVVNNDPLLGLAISSSSGTHTFTTTASSSPTFGYVHATSTTATSIFDGALTVNGNTTLTNATSTSLQTTAFGVGSDYLNDLTGTNLEINNSALSVVANPTFSGLTTFSTGFISGASSTIGAPLFVSEGVYATGTIQTGSYVRAYGTATSTFAGGITITAGGINFALPSCFGSNALTTDASGGVICSALTGDGTGGWTDDGHLVRLTTISDQVGIASSTIPGTAYGFGVGTSTYIAGGLGIGNATTTSGVLETSGLSYIGGLLKVKGTGTSTISDGLTVKSLSATNGLTLTGGVINSTGTGTSTFSGGIYANDLKINLPSCTQALETDASGAIVCGTDVGTGAITSINGLTDATQTFGIVNNDPLLALAISSSSGVHTFTTTASSSPTFGYLHATSTTATSIFDGALTVNGNAILTNATSTALQVAAFGLGSDYLGDLTGTNLEIANSALSVVTNPTFAGVTTLGAGFLSSASSTIGAPLFVSEGVYATGTIQTGSYVRAYGTATSTFAGGITITAGGLNFSLPACSGTNALTTDASGGVICSAITGGGGGWTDDGHLVRLTTISDQVGVASSTVLGDAFGLGVGTSTYIAGGLGIGNATTTDGVLETSGLAYIGGALKVKGSATSTFVNGIDLAGGCFAVGGTCISSGGGGITSLNGLTDSTQTFSVVNNDPLVNLDISSVSPTHTFTITASSSPAYGYIHATSTTATSIFDGALTVNGNTTLTNGTSTSFQTTAFGVGADYLNDLTGTNLEIANSALGVIANPTFTGLTTLSGGFLSTASSTVGAPLFVSEGVYATGTIQTGSYIRSYGSATSTFAGGISITGGGINFALPSCFGTNLALTTDSTGAIVCGSVGSAGAINPNLIYRTLGTTKYYSASSSATDNLAFHFNSGFVSSGASSSISDTLYLAGKTFASSSVRIGSSLTVTSSSTFGNNLSVTGAFGASSTAHFTGGNVLITNGNKLGIGTTTPSTRLSVNGPAFLDSKWIHLGSSSAATLTIGYQGIATNTIPNVTSAFNFATSTTNTPLLTFSTKSSRYGRVGIGTTTPAALLSINALNSPTNNEPFFLVGSSTATRFIVDNHGNVGIGTSSPTQALSNDGSMYIVGGLGIGNATTTSGVLETSGLAYIGGPLKVAGSATSTFTGGVYANDLRINLPSCNGISVLETDANGAITCGADASGGGGSLQGSYDGGATIETAGGTPVVLTETDASASSHDLLQLLPNPATGGTYSGDALRITMDAVDANGYTGNGLHIVVDQSQNTGMPLIIEDDSGVDLLAVSESGGLTLGSVSAGADVTVYGDVMRKGFTVQRSLANIIDLIVYDTTRDSDGGAWRKSLISQQLSWYTETKDDGPSDACVIGTDDRCGTSEFPRKAIIATTASGAYIFDAKDNSLWMHFTQSGTFALGADTNNNPSGVGAVNGVVYVGTNGASATGMYAFDFTQNRMYRFNATNRVQADTTIGTRNTTTSYATDANTQLAIPDAVVNDVSVALQRSGSGALGQTTVAPIDSQPANMNGGVAVAIATDTAVYVYRPDAQKVLGYSEVTGDDYNTVHMTSRGTMYAANETQAQLEQWKNVDKDVTTEINGTPDKIFDEGIARPPITFGTVPIIQTSPSTIAVVERASAATESAATGNVDSGDIVYFGTSGGLAEIHTSGGLLNGPAWSKITTTGSSTPFMIGGVRSIFLFDEAAGSTDAVTAVGLGANIMDPANATNPTYGGAGVRGTSVNFNNNSYLCSDANNDGTCDNDTDYNVGAIGFTVSVWFKHSTTAALDTIFEKCWIPATPTAGTGCAWGGMNASGQIIFGIDDDATWTAGSSMDDLTTGTGQSYADNQWHHAIFTNTDTDICVYVDGRQVVCDTALAATATLDTSAVAVTIGGSCTGAACVTGTNFWDGSLDDFTWSSNTGTTQDGLTAASARRLYLDARAALLMREISVTDATTFSASTIGDSGETWIPNEFSGQVVEIISGTGVSQTRTVVSNTSTVLTVTPAFSVTPDATSDFRINPEELYGSKNTVRSIAVDPVAPFGQSRPVYVGTSDGSDGGGITVFRNTGIGMIKTGVYHSNAGVSTDDLGNSWSGTDADDIQAVAAYSGTTALGSLAFIRAFEADVSAEDDRAQLIGAINGIQTELIAKYQFGSTQDLFGPGLGADLAERYSSTETLESGDIVAVDPNMPLGVKRSTGAYQKDILGVVATKPGLILGPITDTTYPIALVGRVPVKFTTENGIPKVGDRIAAGSIPGYGMRATKAGRVLGTVIEVVNTEQLALCPGDKEDAIRRCGQITVFVNLVDYGGISLSMLMNEKKELSLVEGFAQQTSKVEVLPACDSILTLGTTTQVNEFATTTQEIKGAAEPCSLSGNLTTFGTSTVATSTLSISTSSSPLNYLVQESSPQPVAADRDLDILEFLREYKATIDTNSSLDSEIFTDRLNAGIELFSPRIVANGLRVDTIDALGEQIRINPDILFFGRPYFTTDTAGFALVKKGDSEVVVTFEREYLEKPIVNASMATSDGIATSTQSVAAIQALFEKDVRFLIGNASTTGFAIYLNKPAEENLLFNWIALAVKGARTSESSTGIVVDPTPTPSMPEGNANEEKKSPAPTETPSEQKQDPKPPPDESKAEEVQPTEESSPETIPEKSDEIPVTVIEKPLKSVGDEANGENKGEESEKSPVKLTPEKIAAPEVDSKSVPSESEVAVPEPVVDATPATTSQPVEQPDSPQDLSTPALTPVPSAEPSPTS